MLVNESGENAEREKSLVTHQSPQHTDQGFNGSSFTSIALDLATVSHVQKSEQFLLTGRILPFLDAALARQLLFADCCLQLFHGSCCANASHLLVVRALLDINPV